MKVLNLRHDSIKLLEEIIGETSRHKCKTKQNLEKTSETQEIRNHNKNKQDYIKPKFLHCKGNCQEATMEQSGANTIEHKYLQIMQLTEY